jgi:hypothetical protein
MGLSISARRWSAPGALRFGSLRIAASTLFSVNGQSSRLWGPGGSSGAGDRERGRNRPSLTAASWWDMVSTAATGPSGWQYVGCVCLRRRIALILDVAAAKFRSSASQNARYAWRRARLTPSRKACRAARYRSHHGTLSRPTARCHLR